MIGSNRISIFTGHYGSGKSEISVNYALQQKKSGRAVTLIDLDIVNTFFRSTDAKEVLEQAGIKLIKPLYANTNVDIPVLPAEISGVFGQRGTAAIFDVGGDDVGSRALSRYKADFDREPFDMYLVVNTRRPFAGDFDGVMEMLSMIQTSSRLKVTGLVNNTNLLSETTPDIVMEGYALLLKVSDATGIPIAFTAGQKEILDQTPLKPSDGLLYLAKHMGLAW